MIGFEMAPMRQSSPPIDKMQRRMQLASLIRRRSVAENGVDDPARAIALAHETSPTSAPSSPLDPRPGAPSLKLSLDPNDDGRAPAEVTLASVGDALALVGAMLAAAYVTVGEAARQDVSTPSYTLIAYSSSAVVLLPVCLLAGAALTGYPASAWALIAALTLLAQLLGHSLINATLRTTSATVTSMGILFEMPIATILAALFLGQWPPLAVVPALVLLLVGVAIVVRAGAGSTPSATLAESPT